MSTYKRKDHKFNQRLRRIAERKESEKRIHILARLRKRGIVMQYTGNMMFALNEVALSAARKVAENQRSCVHCGESWDIHSNIGAHCPVRENGMIHHFSTESFE